MEAGLCGGSAAAWLSRLFGSEYVGHIVPIMRSLCVRDDIDRDLHCRNRSSVLKPVSSFLILRPAHSRSIVRSDSIPVVSNRALQDVHDARPALMVVHGAERRPRREGEPLHSKLAACHAVHLGAEVDRGKHLRCPALRLRCQLFVEASSAGHVRHRLNRGGYGRLNAILYHIALLRPSEVN